MLVLQCFNGQKKEKKRKTETILSCEVANH